MPHCEARVDAGLPPWCAIEPNAYDRARAARIGGDEKRAVECTIRRVCR